MAYPQIIYNPGTGPVTVPFQRPARQLPAYDYKATRHDNIASSGVRESVLERVDSFLTFEMEWVGIGSDVATWNSFMTFALSGGQFSFYPDASLPAFTNYWLEDTDWVAAYKSPGQYTFKLKFRQVVT
ncbi:MAG TPA: hypothetical protein VG860_15905 [Terriglobia bacterium]|jgi:hypothetical protein|nr:hypothetical protein [Terriglobia bacterium]